ncbi:MAG: hypothetical protein LBR98_00670 [Syntrophomonadaceae bacterium]|jgi:hypothetical protein|nr:hypothetical protein [Syntrophomonadaceae bacterium]
MSYPLRGRFDGAVVMSFAKEQILAGNDIFTDIDLAVLTRSAGIKPDIIKRQLMDVGFRYIDIPAHVKNQVPETFENHEKFVEFLHTLLEQLKEQSISCDELNQSVYGLLVYFDEKIQNDNDYKNLSSDNRRDLAGQYLQKTDEDIASALGNRNRAGFGLGEKANLKGKLCFFLYNAFKNHQVSKLETSLKYSKIYNVIFAIRRKKKTNIQELLSFQYAEGCIEQIQEEFKDYEQAWAIYNDVLSKGSGRYYNLRSNFSLRYCNSCGKISAFSKNAKLSGLKCSHCQTTFPEVYCCVCNEPVIAVDDICPKCGLDTKTSSTIDNLLRMDTAALEIDDLRRNIAQAEELLKQNIRYDRRFTQEFSKVQNELRLWTQIINQNNNFKKLQDGTFEKLQAAFSILTRANNFTNNNASVYVKAHLSEITPKTLNCRIVSVTQKYVEINIRIDRNISGLYKYVSFQLVGKRGSVPTGVSDGFLLYKSKTGEVTDFTDGINVKYYDANTAIFDGGSANSQIYCRLFTEVSAGDYSYALGGSASCELLKKTVNVSYAYNKKLLTCTLPESEAAGILALNPKVMVYLMGKDNYLQDAGTFKFALQGRAAQGYCYIKEAINELKKGNRLTKSGFGYEHPVVVLKFSGMREQSVYDFVLKEAGSQQS